MQHEDDYDFEADPGHAKLPDGRTIWRVAMNSDGLRELIAMYFDGDTMAQVKDMLSAYFKRPSTAYDILHLLDDKRVDAEFEVVRELVRRPTKIKIRAARRPL